MCAKHHSCLAVQVVGASEGLSSLHQEAAHWSGLLSLSPLSEVLPAIHALITAQHGGPEVAQMFGPQLMAAVGRAVLSGDAVQQQQGLPLLVELCMALKPEGGCARSGGLPVILTAQQNGVKLAAYINSVVSSWPDAPMSSATAPASATWPESSKADSDQAAQKSVAVAWVAVLSLPHANSDPGQIVKLLQRLVASTASVLEQQSSGKVPGTTALNSDKSEVLFLHCYARGVLASVLDSYKPAELPQHLHETLDVLSQHMQNFHVVRCAAEVASAITKGGNKLPGQQLKVMRKHTNSNALALLLLQS